MTFEESTHQFDNVQVPTINFHCPDFFNHLKLYNYFNTLKKEAPYVFMPGVNIFSVYGCFGSCIWNGGSTILGPCQSKREIKDLINYYNYELQLPITLTFTNPLISTQSQCEDAYSNVIAECAHNKMNYVNVASPVLLKYLKKYYPDFHYCRSIVAAQNKPYDLTECEISVLQRAKNNDWDYLNTIPEEDRGKIELLLNDPCPDDCPYIYTHYKAMAKGQLQFTAREEDIENIECHYPFHFPRARMMLENKTFISLTQIYEDYVPKGFRHFKFSGRINLMRGALGALHYLIVPIYQEDVLYALFQDYRSSPYDIIYN